MTTSRALAMSESASSGATTERAQLDAAIAAVQAKKTEFARLPVREKIALLKACIPKVVEATPDWIDAACQAKGLPKDRPVAGEEWLAGPMVTIRNLRLLVESLEQIERHGDIPLGSRLRTRPDGRVEVDAFPASRMDGALFSGFKGSLLMQAGMTAGEVQQKAASFYKRSNPEGGVTLVLGAGNVSSIGPMDCFYKQFVEGNVCILKMNPVNEYLGPIFERAFSPLIERDYLKVVYGDGGVGAYLCQHEGIEDIHITGSDRTHDTIVWGPPGPERDRRKAENDPVLKKTISSELGNVSPVILVPYDYSEKELWFQARNVATMMTNNASFNCNAAKMLVTGKGWAQRDTFLGMVKKALSSVPPRKAYYPGAHDRYRHLTEGRTAERIGDAEKHELPWTIITGLDPDNASESLFCTEPFCAILSNVELSAGGPAEFIAKAVDFCNDRLWGTLNAAIIIHPKLEKDPQAGPALDKAILDLRYGTVAINHWPGLAYGFVSVAWGGHPSSTLENIQSGLGWVHNTLMLEGIEKTIIRGPLTVFPKPPWFLDHAKTHEIGAVLVDVEANPSWLKVPLVAAKALRG